MILIGEEFTIENGLRTNKMSMKHDVIVKKYESELNSMYDGSGGHPITIYSKEKE